MSPTVFESDAVRLVIRHDAGAPAGSGKDLVYFADDALFAGMRDRGLPLDHRLKLWAADCDAARRLAPAARAVVVSTWEVAEDLRRVLRSSVSTLHVIDPYWPEPLADLTHFAEGGPPRVAFLGAGTHRFGAAFAAAVIRRIVAALPETEFLLSANHRRVMAHPPPTLKFLEQTRWPDYRARIVSDRRHVALYPTPDTPHARARSANKLIEHAIIGAAPIYSETWPMARMAAGAGGGMALGEDPALWAETAIALLRDRVRSRTLAEGAQRLAGRLRDVDAQRSLWRRLLRIDR